jgi:hypothetical protein
VRKVFVVLSLVAALSLGQAAALGQPAVPRIAVSGGRFVVSGSGETFTPYGFNYDRDWQYRLIEEYWGEDWDKVEQDFARLEALRANVVRIHLQYRLFMDGPSSPNETNLSRLKDLVVLAERHGIYLDVVGLGSYRPERDPAWYVELSEQQRWAAQATFWGTIAEALAGRPGVFAFNLMNEPIVAGERLEPGAWVPPEEIEGLHYVHYITLDPAGRDRADIAVAWIRQMTRAIRAHDRQRLITVGVFPLFGVPDASGFAPRRIAQEVDFIAVHLYPEAGRVDETLRLLAAYDAGTPVLIEEVFPLNGGIDDYRKFLEGSRAIADGWVSFYWGEPAQDEPRAGLVRAALAAFEDFGPVP